MQASTGVNGEHYFMGTSCDPNLLAYAAQHALFTYPPKSMYTQVLQAPQVSQFMLPHQALIQPMTAAAPTSLTPIQSMPDMDKAALEEPIEAGSLNYRRKNTSSCSSEEKSQYRRHSATWETMTDDERELIQRQKRKEEAFKTALCDAYKRAGVCPYGDDCRFAHGENELRMPSQPRGKAHPKYKTQLCDKFSTYGHCPYGPRCQFIHKLKKGLPLMEYNRALAQGSISPAREEEIVNPDDSDLSIHQYRSSMRRRSGYDFSDSGYSGKYMNSAQSGSRRNLASEMDSCDDERRSKAVYPPMQVVNIEMATGQKKHQRRSLPSVINQADYQASMASGKIFGKPENIRTYGAMIRANEETVDRSTTGTTKKERQCVPSKKELSLIREEDTIAESSQLHSQQAGNVYSKPVQTTQQKSAVSENSPWYEKIFGKKMSVISEESNDSLQNDTTHNGGALDD